MALPNAAMDAVPFTPLTAEFLDDMIENIESLSAGTGFDTGAIGTSSIADHAVTSTKMDMTTFEKLSVSASATQTISGTSTLNFDTVVFDTASAFNTTTHRYTVPTTGLWLAFIRAKIANTSQRMYLTLTDNTSLTTLLSGTDSSNSGGFPAGILAGLTSMTAGHSISGDIFLTSGSIGTQRDDSTSIVMQLIRVG